jgi:hypothetical protein
VGGSNDLASGAEARRDFAKFMYGLNRLRKNSVICLVADKTIPRLLKPSSFHWLIGTDKSVPFQKVQTGQILNRSDRGHGLQVVRSGGV